MLIKFSCFSFRPQKLVNTINDLGKELQIERSSFPSAFKIIDKRAKASYQKAKLERCFYECETINKNFNKWKKSYRDNHDKDIQIRKQKESDQQRKQLQTILSRRRFWKDKIVNSNSNIQESMFETDDECEEFEKTEEIDHILKKPSIEPKAKEDLANLLKFYIPDFNMWRLRIYSYETEEEEKTDELELLPKSFRWLLNFAASVIQQHPINLYNQISLIEYQYMMHLQPMELVENVLLLQNDLKLPSIEICKNSKFSDTW